MITILALSTFGDSSDVGRRKLLWNSPGIIQLPLLWLIPLLPDLQRSTTARAKQHVCCKVASLCTVNLLSSACPSSPLQLTLNLYTEIPPICLSQSSQLMEKSSVFNLNYLIFSVTKKQNKKTYLHTFFSQD